MSTDNQTVYSLIKKEEMAKSLNSELGTPQINLSYYQFRLGNLYDGIMTMTIKDPDTLIEAQGLKRSITQLEKELENDRKAVLEPYRETVNKINDIFKAKSSQILSLKKAITDELLLWEAQQARKAEMLRAELEIKEKNRLLQIELDRSSRHLSEVEEAKARQNEEYRLEQLKLHGNSRIDTEMAINSVRGLVKVWSYEVIEEDKVPREFCNPSPAKLLAAVRNGNRSIPGVRIYQKESVR